MSNYFSLVACNHVLTMCCLLLKTQTTVVCSQLLREVGFEAVTVEDRTEQFGQIIEGELKSFEKSKDQFIKVG